MNHFLSIFLDKNSQTPIYQQLGDALLNLIEEGVIPPNSKLPPIRKMADNLKINSSTVVSAYKYLENKHAVYSVTGSGTYSAPLKTDALPEPVRAMAGASTQPEKFENIHINLSSTTVPPKYFPVKDFKEMFNQVLDRDLGSAFSYHNPQGYEPLLESITQKLLKEEYGIQTTADKIIIISGAQQGIDIVSKALISSGDCVFVEKPTYYGAVGAFLSRGASIIQVPMAADGIDIHLLENYIKLYRPKLLYVMTYYQTPTGISQSLETKRKLLDLVNRYDTYVIEEDNISDFNYGGEKIVPLKALDYKNRVIYIKSISKILMPGLRLGFCAVPGKLLPSLLNAKHMSDISAAGFVMRGFDLFLRQDMWKKHKAGMIRNFKQSYQVMDEAIRLMLENMVTYQPPGGGLGFWLKINNGVDSSVVAENLIQKGVLVTPGNIFSIEPDKSSSAFLRLGFGAVDEKQIVTGIEILRDTLKAVY